MSATAPIRVNRAPVLTLWAAVVAERLGYPPDTALTPGRFVTGSSARAKAETLADLLRGRAKRIDTHSTVLAAGRRRYDVRPDLSRASHDAARPSFA
jgi:hypothetical protein